MKKNDILNYWKVRVSYSEVGNDPDPFLTMPTNPINMGLVNISTQMPNPDLRPERTKSWEVGTNLYFFKNRFFQSLFF